MPGKRAGGEAARFFGRRFCFDCSGAQIAQCTNAPLAYHFVGDLMHGRQHPTDARGRALVRDRTVGDGEMRLLDEAMAIDFQKNVVIPRRRSTAIRRINQWPQDVPDFFPAFA
jgi:hypothetical protein